MKIDLFKWGRVYINIGKEFFENVPNIDLKKHIELVAIIVKKTNDGTELIKSDGTICMGKTKLYIASEATKFLNGLAKTSSSVNASSLVSKTQINNLITAFENKEGHISCHSLIFLHIIKTIIKKHEIYNTYYKELNVLIESICKIVNEYAIWNDDNDELVKFLLDTLSPVKKESSRPEDFPALPKWFARNEDENV